MKPPTEAEEAKVLVAYLRVHGYKFFHAPSETGSSDEAKRRAIRMKQQGTVRGYPDYTIIVRNKLVFIELKRAKKSLSKVSPEQREWLTALAACGTECAIAYGANEAIEFIESIANSNTTNLTKNPFPADILATSTPDSFF
jgi:hypothetical protein